MVNNNNNDNSTQRRIYTVSELNADIKALLEENFPFIWICGEISNLSTPVSGHSYFTLKDGNAQINAVMFRGQKKKLTFSLENGMGITGLGRISLYEPRGNYQIIFEHLEPEGIGALQVAFEQLKARLFDEGLFDETHKKPIPFLPQKIGIITSPTGAVVHDILKIISRRFENLHIEIIPVKVQGDGSAEEIVSGLELLNTRADVEVIILARGGGSLEDLSPFNSEAVARAVFMSEIPVISAIGHETDFTIADFTADLRASTPSVAAELVVPVKEDLLRRCAELSKNMTVGLDNHIEYLRTLLNGVSKRLVHPKRKIQDLRLRTDDLTNQMIKELTNNIIKQKRDRLLWRTDKLYSYNPLMYVKSIKVILEKLNSNLLYYFKKNINNKRALCKERSARLLALSPTAILSRGYSITRTIPDASVVRDSKSVSIGQDLEIMVEKGFLICKVKGKSDNAETNI